MRGRAQVLSEETCPISEEQLGTPYRASQLGLSELVSSVGSEARALLALYCYRRAHLQNIGLAIATTCSEADLDRLGASGALLFSRSRDTSFKSVATHHRARRTVTLATGSLQK